jgi:phosphoadenosine phosphosulfate reductase
MSATTPDLEQASAQEVLAYAIEHFHPQLKTACSFQKEETVLAHMLSEIAPDAKLFTIDTGVLFPETLATWKLFEERFGLPIEVIDASSGGEPWSRENCCGQAKVDGLEQALVGLEAWVTGIRREQSPTRANAAKLERDEKRGIWKVSPLADWTNKDIWNYIFAHDLPYNPLHDHGYDSIGCAPCTLPGSGRDGRWAGEDKTECGLHV